MKEQRPEQHLFRAEQNTFAVLDGASVPDLPIKLYEMRAPNVCLYRGEIPPDIVYVAPYLVQLVPETEFTKWLLAECWGKHWGIFAQSQASLTGMRKHFRSLLTVYDEDGKPFLFRYYDPRAFLTFVPTCNGDELRNFFGRVSYYFVEAHDAKKLHRFQLTNNELRKTNLNLKAEE